MQLILISLHFFVSSFITPTFLQETVEAELQGDTIQTSENIPAPLRFDKRKLERLKQDPDLDYSEKVEEENWWTRFKRYLDLQWQRLLNWLFGDYRGNGLILFLVELIPYLILAGIVFFAVWLFIRLNPGRAFLEERETGSISLTQEEEIVQSRDINKLIEEAVSRGNFRLAVRYHYLLVLQQLSEGGHITYEFSKTNEEYLKEIDLETLRNQFGQITRIYDFIWYGSFDVTAEIFHRAEREFGKMEKLVKQQHEQNA